MQDFNGAMNNVGVGLTKPATLPVMVHVSKVTSAEPVM